MNASRTPHNDIFPQYIVSFNVVYGFPIYIPYVYTTKSK